MSQGLTVVSPKAVQASATIEALLADWHKALERTVASGDLSNNTRVTYQDGMKRFVAWAQASGSPTVTDETLQDWKADLRAKGRRPGTINTWLSGIRAFFSWAVGAHLMVYNPTLGVKGTKRRGSSTKHQREALSDEEVYKLLSQPDRSTPIGKRDYAIMILMLYTGGRTVELHRADLKDLHTKSGKLVLDVQGKGRQEKDEILLIDEPAVEDALRDWLTERGARSGPLFICLGRSTKGDRLSLRRIRFTVKNALTNAGITGYKTTHSLRHTAITSAVLNGAPLQKAQTMARHANISTTLIYFHEKDRMDHPAESYISYGEKKL